MFGTFNVNSNLYSLIEIWHKEVYGSCDFLLSIRNPVIVDIGANIGAFSVFCIYKNPTATVYAYEPEENNYFLLEENVRMNNLQGSVFVEKKAVSANNKERTLYVVDKSSGKNSLVINYGHGVTQIVQSLSLAEIFSGARIDMCHLLKLDCEGSEYEIILNTPKKLFNKIQHIILEFHDVAGHGANNLVTFLEEIGYKISVSKQHSTISAAR